MRWAASDSLGNMSVPRKGRPGLPLVRGLCLTKKS